MKLAHWIALACLVSGRSCDTAPGGDDCKTGSPMMEASPGNQGAVPSQNSPSSGKEPWSKMDVCITPHEQEVIQRYFQDFSAEGGGRKRSPALPSGSVGKGASGGDLPPGWEKQCVPGKVMPESLFKECRPLPREVVADLPPPPPGTVLVVIRGKVLRLARATREILDVFDVPIL